MKAKRNQANVLAKECMVSALMQLLETKPLSAISVTELTEKAGVSRMTYYRNYQSKEEIFQDYLDDICLLYTSRCVYETATGMSRIIPISFMLRSS